MAYFIVAMSTSRMRVRPVTGSMSWLNGIGTKWPACIEISTPVPPDVPPGGAQVAVGVPLHVLQLREVRRVELLDDAFGDDRHAVPRPVRQPLDDGAHARVHARLELHPPPAELLGGPR